MKLVNRIALIVTGLISIGFIKDFFSKYDVLVFDKNDVAQARKDQDFDGMDLRGTPTHVCVCGSNIFYIKAVFDDYEIATYFLDMQCAECGNLATAPTPLDRERQE
jgi:hypothetical protein